MRSHDAEEQLALVDASLHDTRQAAPTGVTSIDLALRRGGLLPGTLALLGGRTGTRKSTIMVNMVVSLAEAKIPVGLVGLDEQPWQYVVALMSAREGKTRNHVEDLLRNPEDPRGRRLREDWLDLKDLITLYDGRKPTPDMLDAAAAQQERTPQVMFVDYLGKLAMPGARDHLASITGLVNELAVWTTDSGISLVVLHQLGRNDEYGGSNSRNAGHVPVTLAQLKYGGEEDADVVFGAYRPAMDPIGNMELNQAKTALGKAFDQELYDDAVGRVRRFANSTFLQLLKNRGGEVRMEAGVELISRGQTLQMTEKEAEDDGTGRGSAREAGARAGNEGDVPG